MEVIRKYALGFKDVIEKQVTMGYSYYKKFDNKRKMKIMTAGESIYIEFNRDISGEDLVYLNETDRANYHAGGVRRGKLLLCR